jgi:putative flavoprotein involved in K+ transport
MTEEQHPERIETLIIGGGQAGLSVAYQLARQKRPFLVLDAHERVGDAWRKRWDSLRLFTPARYDGLPGASFPASGSSYITKDQMADFLEEYAQMFDIPIRTSERVERLSRQGELYRLETTKGVYLADNVVVAMASYQKPKIPQFARDLDPNIVQLHSLHYKNSAELPEKDTLVVGTGNSGAEIALELSKTRSVSLSGRDGMEVPFRIETPFANLFGIPMVRFIGHHILNLGTPMGRKVAPKLKHEAAPRVRVKMRDVVAAGVKRVPRVAGVEAGLPVLEDGRVMDVACVVWCTGFTPGFSWIDLPIFDPGATEPRHTRGVVAEQPGLYFVGLHFQHAATSTTVTGVHRDASYVVGHLDRTMREKSRLLPARAPTSPLTTATGSRS